MPSSGSCFFPLVIVLWIFVHSDDHSNPFCHRIVFSYVNIPWFLKTFITGAYGHLGRIDIFSVMSRAALTVLYASKAFPWGLLRTGEAEHAVKMSPRCTRLHTTKADFSVGESQAAGGQRLHHHELSSRMWGLCLLGGGGGRRRTAQGVSLIPEVQAMLSTFPLPEGAIGPTLVWEREGENGGRAVGVCGHLWFYCLGVKVLGCGGLWIFSFTKPNCFPKCQCKWMLSITVQSMCFIF